MANLASVSDISGPPRVATPRRAAAAVGHFFEAVLILAFVAIGWVFGAFWRVCVTSAAYGFRSGAGWPQPEPGSAEPPAES